MDGKIRYALCFLILPLLCSTSTSYAEESNNEIKLSLQDCISRALESNLNIRIQRISPEIQDTLLTKAKGSFDPTASLGSDISSSQEPSSTPALSGADIRTSESQAVSIGLSDPVVTGGQYGLFFSSNRSESNSTLQTLNPAYRSGLTFSVNQPILEGFGIAINRASITIASNNKDISLLSLKSELIDTLSSVQDAYWELVFDLENLKVQQLALKQAQDLLNINKRFKEEGKATISDVLQAQAAVASREADVIAAEDAVRDSEDNLKRITNLVENPEFESQNSGQEPYEASWDAVIVPVDQPSFETLEADLRESIATALADRPEYTQAKLDLENSDISIKVAKDRRLPILDLEGSYSLNGLGDGLGDPLSQVGTADYRSWSLGLALRMPIGERGAKADLRRSMYEKEQKLLALKDLEQQIITEVRGAVRQLETDGKRIEATRAAEELARQVVLTEERKHGLGLSTSYELLQFQANLATATKNRLRAVIDYRRSIVAFYRALGVTLDKLGIELRD
jgi:outer membrane protein TolC